MRRFIEEIKVQDPMIAEKSVRLSDTRSRSWRRRSEGMIDTSKYLEHVKLNPHKIEFGSNTDGDTSAYTGTITANIVARVVEKADDVIVDAIIKEAAAEGVTDLFLIDKEFIMTAIKNEMARRKAMIIKGEENEKIH